MEKLPRETSGSYQDVSDKLNFLAAYSIGIPGYNEEEREALEAFYSDDPYGIMAAYNSRWNVPDVVQSVRSLSDRDRFYAIKSLMNADIRAQNLIGQANYYIAVSNVLETEYDDRNFDSLSEEQRRQAVSTAIDLHDRGEGFSLPPWDTVAKSPTNLDGVAIDKLYCNSPDYVKTAFDFADYGNAATVGMLNHHVQNEIRDYDAKDIVTGQPAFFNASTFSEYHRLTKPLPPTIQYWYEHGLLAEQGAPEQGADVRIFNWPVMERIANIVLPEGVNDVAFLAYEKQIERIEKGIGLPSIRATNDTLLSLRQKIFREIKVAFSESTERLHPDVDTAVRELAVSVLKSSGSNKHIIPASRLHDYKHLPLSKTVPMINSMAEHGGFYANL